MIACRRCNEVGSDGTTTVGGAGVGAGAAAGILGCAMGVVEPLPALAALEVRLGVMAEGVLGFRALVPVALCVDDPPDDDRIPAIAFHCRTSCLAWDWRARFSCFLKRWTALPTAVLPRMSVVMATWGADTQGLTHGYGETENNMW